MAEGYTVDPAALRLVADGINATIAELNDLGFPGAGAAGEGFAHLALTSLQLGHAGLSSGLERFCGRWDWGVNRLVTDSGEIADKLNLSAGAYHDFETYLGGVYKQLAADIAGDPHDTAPVREQSWSQLAEHSRDQLSQPNYSGESLVDAGRRVGEVWTQLGRDAAHQLAPLAGEPPAPTTGGPR